MKVLITEKTVKLAKSNKFTLCVDSNLSKREIKEIIKKDLSLDVTDVQIQNKKTIKKLRKGNEINVRGYKKAIVTLKSGQKFPGYEILEEEKKKQERERKLAKKKRSEQEKTQSKEKS